MSKQWDDDAFEGSSGLHQKFDIAITESRAMTPEGWSNPTWVISGELTLPDGTKTDGDIRLSMGAFEPGDDTGSFVIHQTQDPTKKMSAQSAAMMFISSSKQAENGDALRSYLQENSRVIDGIDLQSRDLSIWKGLSLRVDHRKVDRTNPETGVVKAKDIPYIVAYLGTENAALAAAPAGASAATNGSAVGAINEEEAAAMAKSAASFVKYLEALQEKGVDASEGVASKAFFDAARA